ncbi:membrane steroid-binding protein 1 [Helianthus annuus]|uniref:Putative cytochrome b5-like heme/steroid binding domain-containing protein n=1 Tax=Helianthus annuus TaxID=4232 RepID=A0A251SGJ6_HELAN|nr:membrane steroid-binding protein 1 [Helianthus annuus]
MAVQLLETLEQSITAYTGLSSATFITLLALSIAGYYAVSGFFSGDNHPPPRSRSYEEDMQPLPPPVQLGEVSEEELKGYDGNDPKKPLLMAIKGQIYDVSQSRMFYGPGGPYALFAGKDASRALAKMSFEEKDLNGDLTGLGVFELEALQDWEYKFMSKYVKVGTIKKPEPTPEPSTNDQPAEPSATEPAEPSAAEPAEPSAAKPAEPSATEPAEPSAAKPAEPSLMEPAESTAAEPADHVPSEVAVGETKDETTSEANKHE